MNLRFDREQESEADHIGVFLMTFAGYDPEQAVAFWQRMQAAGQQAFHLPEILSDHPSDGRRLNDVKQWVETAVAAKQAYDSGRIALPGRRTDNRFAHWWHNWRGKTFSKKGILYEHRT